MQVFMQVLNAEPGGEAGKAANKAETLLATKGDGAFAALLENTEDGAEADTPDSPQVETGEDRDATRPIPSPDTREKTAALARQTLLGGPGQGEPAPPPKVIEGAPETRVNAWVPAAGPAAKYGARAPDAKALPPVAEGPAKPAPDPLPRHIPDASEVAAKAQKVKPETPVFGDKPPVDGRAAPNPSDDKAPAPVVALINAEKNPGGDKAAPGEAAQIRPAPADRPETVLKTLEALRAGNESDAPVRPANRPAPISALPEPRATLPQQAKPPTLPERAAASLAARPDHASDMASKGPPARPVSVANQIVQTRPSRLAQRDSGTEVTIATTPRQHAHQTVQAPPDPAAVVQQAAKTQDMFPGAAAFGRDAVALRDEGPIQLSAIEGAEPRRASEAPSARVEVQARPVITQLVQAARSAIDGMIEVKLAPEELGRVRLAMTSGEAGMTVTVTAERAETLDLIRRNIDLFAADLTDQGFSDLNFSFGQEDAGDRQGEADDRATRGTASPSPDHLAERRAVGADVPDGRLDIRL